MPAATSLNSPPSTTTGNEPLRRQTCSSTPKRARECILFMCRLQQQGPNAQRQPAGAETTSLACPEIRLHKTKSKGKRCYLEYGCLPGVVIVDIYYILDKRHIGNTSQPNPIKVDLARGFKTKSLTPIPGIDPSRRMYYLTPW